MTVFERRTKFGVRESLRASLFDGVYSSVMMGSVESYFIPLAIALKATAASIASLATLPGLIGALMQSQAASLTDLVGDRKKAMRLMASFQGLSLLFFLPIPFLPPENRVSALLGLMILYTVFGNLASPIWGSLMSEYLPPGRRSGYFGWRNRFLGSVIVGAGISAGLILNYFGSGSLRGFGIIFLIAGASRLMSWRYLGFYHETGLSWDRRKSPRPRLPAGRLNSNFLHFSLFCALLTGAINLVAPFFPIYLLQNLGYSYLTYTILVFAVQAAMYFMMAHWGWLADKSGNMKIVRAAAWAMIIIPALWILPPSRVYLFFVQVVSGLIWAGYNLCTTNFIYDAVPACQRVRATVIFNMLNGTAAFIGAWLGGQLIAWIPPVWGQKFFTLAIISLAARVLVLLFVLPDVREVRPVQSVTNVDLFYSLIGIRPLLNISRGAFRFVFGEEG